MTDSGSLAATLEAWHRALRTGETYQIEHRVQISDGSYHWHLSRAMPVRDKDGRIVMWFGTATDISNVKQAENALRELNETLEQRVAERTELAEARTRQLQALAVELIEAEERERRRIAELLHDDLQQVLAAARFQLQAARLTEPSAPMLASVESLLEDSIAKSRRLSHELSPAILHHSGLLTALDWLIRQMDEQFGLKIELQTDARQRFESTPLKFFLFRAVQALMFNVVKHAGVKHARLALSAADDILVITVNDHGKGFNPHILDASAMLSDFGLLSLRERARYLGGDLAIDSLSGQGSTFSLTVPIRIETVIEPQAPAAVQSPEPI